VSRPDLRSALLTAVSLVVLVAGGVVTGAWLRMRDSVPDLSGTVETPDLRDSVIVRVDSLGIPHIDAGSDRDALWAEGWMHGSERLWQMELLRRTARGRLSELFGSVALPTDRLMRTLDVWGAAGRALAALDTASRADLDAYVAGVNAAMRRHEGSLPPEFRILHVRPRSWSPRASLAIGKLMALDLSDWSAVLARWGATRSLSADRTSLVAPRWPEWAVTTLPGGAGAADSSSAAGASIDGARPPAPRDTPAGAARSSAIAQRAPAARAVEAVDSVPDPDALDPLGLVRAVSLSASNAWVLGGERSATGRPLLANDTHLTLRAPSIWYLVGLRAGAGRLAVAGLSIPGVPGVVIGLDRSVAWGFTDAEVDDMDFAVETVSPDGAAYRTASGWRDFAVRAETLRVRGRKNPEILLVRSTVRGPVISDVLPGVHETLSEVWTAAYTTGGLAGILAMDRARGSASFDSAVRLYDGPAQNVVWIASDGHVGYRLGGAIPRREGWSGGTPAPASAMGDGWLGLVPPDSLPAALFRAGGTSGGDAAARSEGAGPEASAGREPGGGGTSKAGPASVPVSAAPDSLPNGYLVTANNLEAPGLMGRWGWDYDPFRSRLISDRLATAHGWGVREMEDLQRDTHSLLADFLIGQAIGAARAVGADSVGRLLVAWDRRADLDSRAAGLFYTWLYRLRYLIAGDEYRGGRGWFPMEALVRIAQREPGTPWVDDVRTDTVETLAGLERRAMRDAIEASGLRPWRELNRERSQHPLGRVGWLDRLFGFDIGPRPAEGGPHTIRVSAPGAWSRLDSTDWKPPHTGSFGPSERFVAVLDSAGPRGWFLLPTGEDGNPFGPHYRDMASRWYSGGALFPVPLRRAAIRAITVGRLRLVPPTPPGGSDRETPSR